MTFTDSQINYYTLMWNRLPISITSNSFMKSVFSTFIKKKELSAKQWYNLKYTLENGKTPYNGNQLSTKN